MRFMMHSTSSDAQEYFWASLEQTIFDVQLVNLLLFFLLFLYRKYMHAVLYLSFLPKDLLLQQDKRQV